MANTSSSSRLPRRPGSNIKPLETKRSTNPRLSGSSLKETAQCKLSLETTQGVQESAATNLETTSEGRYKPIDRQVDPLDIEDLEDYRTGGHFPADLGQIILEKSKGKEGCFEIVHKLGHGPHATVWLCLNVDKHEWNAVKIFKARYSGQAEMAFKKFFDGETKPAEAASEYIQAPLWVGFERSENGHHTCYVLPLLGPTIVQFDRAAPDLQGKLVQQVAQGLRYLHNRGIVHGGIRPSNILWRLQETRHISKEDMVKLIGEPQRYEVEAEHGLRNLARQHAPRYVVSLARKIRNLKQTDEVTIVDAGIFQDWEIRKMRKLIPRYS